MVDFCKTAEILESENDTKVEIDDSSCQANGTMPPFSELLNVNHPLQLGGRIVQGFDPVEYHWQAAPLTSAFTGCIRNLVLNNQVSVIVVSLCGL